MVHKKAKSKRGTKRQDYKIIKNVAETHRKRRKEAKKNPQKSNGKKKEKIIGIPNNYPFKEELLHTAQILKEQKIQEKMAAKELKKNSSALLNSSMDLEAFMDNVLASQDENDNATTTTTKQKRLYQKKHQPAHMVMNQAKVLLHVLDARDPLFFRASPLEKKMTADQKMIFILNKIDLITRDVAEQWISYLASQNLTIVPFNSTNPSKESLDLLESHFPTETTRVGIVGFPSSGKHTLLQSLKSSGRSLLTQCLLPVPGIVFSQTSTPSLSSRVLFRNYTNAPHVPSPSTTIEPLLSRFTKQHVSSSLNVPFYVDTADLLVQYARKNNYLRRGGVADVESAARGIIQEFYANKIPYYTLPPSASHATATVPVLGDEGFAKNKVGKCVMWEEVEEVVEGDEMPKGYVFGNQDDVLEEEDEDDEDLEDDIDEDEEMQDEWETESEEDDEE